MLSSTFLLKGAGKLSLFFMVKEKEVRPSPGSSGGLITTTRFNTNIHRTPTNKPKHRCFPHLVCELTQHRPCALTA